MQIGIGFNCFCEKLYDRPNASLELKPRMVTSEVVEALLYEYATWTPQ